jgi:hypothetical protein
MYSELGRIVEIIVHRFREILQHSLRMTEERHVTI